ncbi:MAG: hypothetical protein FD173_926 [Gallionellaceae bacterium]|nr:MAG: hypothetical protein FD173_926 [Gallionellaceae bacterium]
MRIAVIENGVVINVIEGDADLMDGINYVHSDSCGIGNEFVGGSFIAAPAPLPTAGELEQAARYARNLKIDEADKAINKAEDTGQNSASLRMWREALRNWPESTGFPDLLTLPARP